MQLSFQQVQKFQALYKDHFDVELTEDEAKEKGLQLVQLIKAVSKPFNRPSKANEYVNYDEQAGPAKDL